MSDQERKLLAIQLAEIKVVMLRLDEAVRGNGKPGLILRIDRLERARAVHGKVVWGLAAGALGIMVQWVRSFWS